MRSLVLLVVISFLLSPIAEAPAAPPAAGVKRALLIGINDYQALPKLRGAINDVETMNAILLSRYGFVPENIRILTNERATRDGILEAFERLARESGKNDVVFVHYSGHGSQVRDRNGDEADQDGMDETICPQDARTPNVPDITDDELDRIIGHMNVRWLVMTIDSCHSGSVLRSADFGVQARQVLPDERVDLYDDPDRAIVSLPMTEKYVLFTGAAANETALDGPFGQGRYHGLFSFGLTRVLASAPPGASARQVMRGIEQELEKLRPRLGGRRLPDPQLEGPRAFLDRSLIPMRRASSGRPARTKSETRLAYAELRQGKQGSLRLVDGVLMGALPGSIWAIYPPRETRFAPGRALARVVVERIAGLDAFVRVVEAGSARLSGGRAVLVAPPPASYDRTPIRLREASASLRTRIESDLDQMFEGAVELVDAAGLAEFVIDCELEGEGEDRVACVVLEADGNQSVARIDEPRGEAAIGIADVVARSVVVRSLLTLSNRSAAMELSLGVVGRPEREQAIDGLRGVIVSPDLAPHRLHFYQPGSVRTRSNSLQLKVESNQACFLTLVSVDSSGRLQQAFPNAFQASDFHPGGLIPANVLVLIPDTLADGSAASFHFDYGPPAGTDTIRAFCMTRREDAELLRERIQTASSTIQSRAAGAIAARSAISRLGYDLSRTVSRGLVELEGLEGSSAETMGVAPAAADWAAASVTLEIGP